MCFYALKKKFEKAERDIVATKLLFVITDGASIKITSPIHSEHEWEPDKIYKVRKVKAEKSIYQKYRVKRGFHAKLGMQLVRHKTIEELAKELKKSELDEVEAIMVIPRGARYQVNPYTNEIVSDMMYLSKIIIGNKGGIDANEFIEKIEYMLKNK